MKKVGLVLSGGGAKGAYEVGVWKALDRMEILPYIDGIYGTSVGALNAALLDTCGAEKAEKIWLEFKKSDFFDFGFDKDYSKESQDSKMKKLIKKYLDAVIVNYALLLFPRELILLWIIKYGLPITQKSIDSIIRNNINFSHQNRSIVAFCMQSKKPHTVVPFDLHKYGYSVRRQILLASSAIPFVFQGKNGIEIEGTNYWDGGADIPPKYHGVNTPTKQMANDGWKKIITVWLDPKAKPDKSLECSQVNIIPSSKKIGKIIKGTIYVSKKKIEKDIDMGFQDTLKKEKELKDLIKGLSPY